MLYYWKDIWKMGPMNAKYKEKNLYECWKYLYGPELETIKKVIYDSILKDSKNKKESKYEKYLEFVMVAEPEEIANLLVELDDRNKYVQNLLDQAVNCSI